MKAAAQTETKLTAIPTTYSPELHAQNVAMQAERIFRRGCRRQPPRSRSLHLNPLGSKGLAGNLQSAIAMGLIRDQHHATNGLGQATAEGGDLADRVVAIQQSGHMWTGGMKTTPQELLLRPRCSEALPRIKSSVRATGIIGQNNDRHGGAAQGQERDDLMPVPPEHTGGREKSQPGKPT